jgi:hypothetical protein
VPLLDLGGILQETCVEFVNNRAIDCKNRSVVPTPHVNSSRKALVNALATCHELIMLCGDEFTDIPVPVNILQVSWGIAAIVHPGSVP